MQTKEFHWITLMLMVFPLEDGLSRLVSADGHMITSLIMVAGSLIYIVVVSRHLFYRN